MPRSEFGVKETAPPGSQAVICAEIVNIIDIKILMRGGIGVKEMCIRDSRYGGLWPRLCHYAGADVQNRNRPPRLPGAAAFADLVFPARHAIADPGELPARWRGKLTGGYNAGNYDWVTYPDEGEAYRDRGFVYTEM